MRESHLRVTPISRQCGHNMARSVSAQVVGRVNVGLDVLEKINDLPADPDDVPYARVIISKCGFTNAAGTMETVDEKTRSARETPDEAAERLQRESEAARNAVR